MAISLQHPEKTNYDVVIVGGAMIGSSIAWFTINNPDFDGSILVVEKDPSYEFTSTSHTNSCIRQQFTAPMNVKISQFAADYVKNFKEFMGDDPRIPHVVLQSYGYMYLADTPIFTETLRESQKIQNSLGAGTKHLSPDEIAAAYPFYNLEGILGANHNLIDEGYFDGATLFDWWKRKAREAGVTYLTNEVVAITRSPNRQKIESLTLKTGEEITCGMIVNASGPRAALTARMAGISIPVEPRKRYTYIFDAETPLTQNLPLTIDPSGVHFRTDGQYYLAGCPPDEDMVPDFDDFNQDHSLWEEKAWPAIANRIPQFEAIKLINSWVGHYAFNVFDQNAILGPHTEVKNFIFANGFSGHGFQQSPAMGRGASEWITFGEYRSLDLSEFSYERIVKGNPFVEKAVI